MDHEDLLFDLDGLRLNQVEVASGTRALNGTAFRFCYVSECDGVPYVPLDAYLSLGAALDRAEATIRAMGEAAGDCRRAYDAWVQSEWEREHAQTRERTA